MSVRPFLWLSGSAQGSRTGGRVRYHSRTTTRGFKRNREVSAAFVTTRANGSFFYVFLRTINLRSGLTILSSLDSVGC